MVMLEVQEKWKQFTKQDQELQEQKLKETLKSGISVASLQETLETCPRYSRNAPKHKRPKPDPVPQQKKFV